MPHLLSSAGGILMFSPGLRLRFQRPKAGLAAARMVVRVLSVVVMPALAMLTVCCSITCVRSWAGYSSACGHSTLSAKVQQRGRPAIPTGHAPRLQPHAVCTPRGCWCGRPPPSCQTRRCSRCHGLRAPGRRPRAPAPSSPGARHGGSKPKYSVKQLRTKQCLQAATGTRCMTQQGHGDIGRVSPGCAAPPLSAPRRLSPCRWCTPPAVPPWPRA